MGRKEMQWQEGEVEHRTERVSVDINYILASLLNICIFASKLAARPTCFVMQI